MPKAFDLPLPSSFNGEGVWTEKWNEFNINASICIFHPGATWASGHADRHIKSYYSIEGIFGDSSYFLPPRIRLIQLDGRNIMSKITNTSNFHSPGALPLDLAAWSCKPSGLYIKITQNICQKPLNLAAFSTSRSLRAKNFCAKKDFSIGWREKFPQDKK